jgi:hypothetical protein
MSNFREAVSKAAHLVRAGSIALGLSALLAAVPSVATAQDRTLPPMGISYDQAIGTIRDVTMRQASNVNGQPRWMGTSRDGLTQLEFIGDRSNLSRVTVMTGVTAADKRPGKMKIAGLRVQVLIQNCAPDWEAGMDWAEKATIKAIDTGIEQSITKNGRRFSVKLSKSLGLLMAIAEKA